MPQASYTFHEDPGHGWLEVTVAELQELGIANKISNCSYINSTCTLAYLEEDCDLSVFLKARGCADPTWERFLNVKHQHHTDNRIRGLRRYSAAAESVEPLFRVQLSIPGCKPATIARFGAALEVQAHDFFLKQQSKPVNENTCFQLFKGDQLLKEFLLVPVMAEETPMFHNN